MNKFELTQELMTFIDYSPSVFHVIENFEDILDKNDFQKLEKNNRWNLLPNKKYYITNNDSSILAFQVGSDLDNNFFRIIGSHSDSPTFRIKPNSTMDIKKHFIKLNTEVYGGPILSTWFDRPLSIAGRVIVKGEDTFAPKSININIDRNLLIIPNMAIHMNREINKGYEYNAQKDTLPLIGLINETFEKDNYLLNIIANDLNIDISDILDFDLFLYDRAKGSFVGNDNEFYSVGKIDNLGMAFTSIKALVNSKSTPYTKIVYIPDNEEIGSSTKQGAASPFLRDILERIIYNLGGDFEDFSIALAKSYMISSDQAHSLHPNYIEANDITNFPVINKGPAIKLAASMSYTSDAVTSSIYKSICEKADVPCQYFVNRSDKRGGSTIGPITTSNLDIKSVDIGNPILSMHSVRELGGVDDNMYLYKSFIEFFK